MTVLPCSKAGTLPIGLIAKYCADFMLVPYASITAS